MQKLKLISLCYIISLGIAPGSALADPLFESSNTLKITLKAPFSTINYERDKSRLYSGQVLMEDGSEIAAEFQVRGNNRLKKDICKYPPLKLYFTKKDVKDTEFAKQKELKLVIACKKRYSEHVRVEYLIYRAFSMFTDNSFRVRWLDLTFQGDKRSRTSPGFFIEQKKRMGKRLELTQVKQNASTLGNLEPGAALLVDLFQFMIGNTDYSILKAPEDHDCCHNVKLMTRTTGKKSEKTVSSNSFTPIPYDFDASGLVNVGYAMPAETIGTRSVKIRKYRGFCKFTSALPDALEVFRSKRSALISLFADDPILSKSFRTKTTRYLEKFFDILENEKKLNRSITSACR
ncbi:MAG: hypothetical protein VB957_18745 [Pseudomonadales bacterium]